MVDVNAFKKEVRNICSQGYTLEFFGGREKFDSIVTKLSESQADSIYEWIKGIVNEEVRPLTTTSKNKYKEWMICDLLSFRKELNIKNTEYRILFIKVKNSFYIEFHFGDHKYYDKLRKQLDLTKKNY